jgi:hypothetical protein
VLRITARGRRAFAALAVAVGLGATAGLASPAGAASVIGPVPAPSATTTITFTTPTDGLVGGQNVTFHTDTTSPDTLNRVYAKICATGNTSYTGTTFGYTGASGIRCVYGPGVSAGGLTGVSPGYAVGPFPYSAVTGSGNLTIQPGTGSVTWYNAGTVGPNTLQCDSTHACDIAVDVSLTGDTQTDTWFIQPLSFAGNPQATTISSVNVGNGQATVNYNLLAAGAPSGNGTIDHYAVSAQPHTYGAGACPASGDVHTVNVTTGYTGFGTPVTGTSANVTGLTNFCQYDFTVTAENIASDGSTHFTGATSAASTGTPASSGPASLSGSVGDSSVNLTWSAASGTPVDYQVNVSPAPSSGPCSSGTCLVGSGSATSFLVTGLSNNTSYTFTVQAVYTVNASNFLSTPSPSAIVTPNADFVHQNITITKPTGQLVISQYCSSLPVDETGTFDPSNKLGGAIPNTNCDISLSGPRTSKIQNDALTTVPRSVTDATTNGSTTVSSATAAFTAADTNQIVTGDGISGTVRIDHVVDDHTVVLTAAASTSLVGGSFTIEGSTVNFGSTSGFALVPDSAAYSSGTHVGHEIDGVCIPGGSTITAVVNGGAIDVSQPANQACANATTREWLSGVTAPKLVTSGPHAGQYLQADGVMNQIYIVDYRYLDTGWTVTGQAATFTDGTDTFSGDALGWQPRVSTQSTVLSGYNTLVAHAGSVVQAATAGGLGTGTTTSHDTTQSSPPSGKTLAYADATSGLGLARLDALLSLAVPLNLPSGTYTGRLTLTAI